MIGCYNRLHILNKPFLYPPSAFKIKMKVNGCGLNVVMTQAVFDISDRIASIKHVNGTGMAEAVSRINRFETFGGQGFGKVFLADAIDAVTAKSLFPLIDKKAVLIQWLWGYAVFFYIELEKLRSLGLKLYEPEPIPFSQNSQGFLLWIKIIEIQRCDFTGSCARIIE